MQDYRKLRVWDKAHTLALAIRRVTRAFPRSGYSSLRTQMVRAAESVVLNIVEGCGSRTSKDFARFLDIAVKSTMEVEVQLDLAKGHGVLPERHWETLTIEAVDTRRMLGGLRARVLGLHRESSAVQAEPTSGDGGVTQPEPEK